MLNFQKCKILFTYGVQRAETRHHAKFSQNRSIHCEDIAIFDFSRWRPSAMLDLSGEYLVHLRRVPVLVGLYHCTKFGYDQCSRFGNVNDSIFDMFGWKTSIPAPKIGVLGISDPLNGLHYQRKPERAHPCLSLHHMSHQACKSSERFDLYVSSLKRVINKKCLVIFLLFAHTPPWTDFHQILHS